MRQVRGRKDEEAAMPLFDFRCRDCGNISEILVLRSGEVPQCEACGSRKLEKLPAAPSSLSGVASSRLPGAGDHGCCGSAPSEAGCAGPGSCCGRKS
jgi:putative FmdB family regulatory protein